MRDAVVGSVAKPAPSRSHRNASSVPSRSVPASRAALTASSSSSIHVSFAAEKYGSIGRPLRCVISSSWPAAVSRSSTAVERLSCHTMFGDSGSPVFASQAITDSPW